MNLTIDWLIISDQVQCLITYYDPPNIKKAVSGLT
jgi:hypothetical protein